MANFSYEYPRPALTVDIVLFSFDKNQKLKTLLIQRGNDPFKGMWAYPGGFVEDDETAEQAAARELWEETSVHGVSLEQLFTETTLNRDPRGWIISTVFNGFVPYDIKVEAGDDAAKYMWCNVSEEPPLAFGHELYLKNALIRCRKRLVHSVFGIELMPEEFDLKSLYKLYLQIIDIPEQIEKIVKRLVNYSVIVRIGDKWRFEKTRYEAVLLGGFLR